MGIVPLFDICLLYLWQKYLSLNPNSFVVLFIWSIVWCVLGLLCAAELCLWFSRVSFNPSPPNFLLFEFFYDHLYSLIDNTPIFSFRGHKTSPSFLFCLCAASTSLTYVAVRHYLENNNCMIYLDPHAWYRILANFFSVFLPFTCIIFLTPGFEIRYISKSFPQFFSLECPALLVHDLLKP